MRSPTWIDLPRSWFPELAAQVGRELIGRAEVLSRHPQLGLPIANREEYREVVLRALDGRYVFQYRYDGGAILMLRVFHAREAR